MWHGGAVVWYCLMHSMATANLNPLCWLLNLFKLQLHRMVINRHMGFWLLRVVHMSSPQGEVQEGADTPGFETKVVLSP